MKTFKEGDERKRRETGTGEKKTNKNHRIKFSPYVQWTYIYTSLVASPPSEEETSNALNGGAVAPDDHPGNRVTSSRVATRTPDQ
jgi:hypothetical protein